jgi:hypothetical protein
MSIATSLTIDGSALQRSDESSSSSSHSSHSRSTGIRVPLPSPSRARLDRRYAQRLAVPAPVSTACRTRLDIFPLHEMKVPTAVWRVPEALPLEGVGYIRI